MRTALEGRLEETAQTLTRNFDKLAGVAVTLMIFTLIALVTLLFSPFSAAIDLALGLIIGAPLVFIGAKQLQTAITQLNPKDRANALPKTNPAGFVPPDPAPVEMPAVPDTDPLANEPAPVPVTEHTTNHLNRP